MHSVKAEGKKEKSTKDRRKDKRERECKRGEGFLKYQTSNGETDSKDMQQKRIQKETDDEESEREKQRI